MCFQQRTRTARLPRVQKLLVEFAVRWREKNQICSSREYVENLMKVISNFNPWSLAYVFRNKSSIFQFCCLPRCLVQDIRCWITPVLHHLFVGLVLGMKQLLSLLFTVDWRKLIGLTTMNNYDKVCIQTSSLNISPWHIIYTFDHLHILRSLFLIVLKRVVSLEKLKTHNSVHVTIFSKSVAGAPIVDQLQDASFTETRWRLEVGKEIC